MTALWDMQRFAGGGAFAGPQTSFENTTSSPVNVETGVISLTSAISNRTVNTARFGYLHDHSDLALSESIPRQTSLRAAN
jgi:hypothetical protein